MESYTGDYVHKLVKKLITELKDKYNATVRAVTMDSDGAHIKARSTLAKEFGDVLFFPCYAHQVNLVFKHLFRLEQFDVVCKKSIEIVNYFNNHVKPLAELRVMQKELLGKTVAMHRPTETRWYSYSNMMNSLLESKLPLQVRQEYRKKNESLTFVFRHLYPVTKAIKR